MFDMEAVKVALKQAVAGLDPEVLEPSYAATLVENFGEMERICAAGKALAARRVSSSGIWRSSGERSPAHNGFLPLQKDICEAVAEPTSG